MSVFRNLRLRLAPPRLTDPEFGRLLFMYIAHAPGRSYWECEWQFPPTDTTISIGLPGGEGGPTAASRSFFLSLPARFEQIIAAARPKLADVWTTWLHAPLPADIFSTMTLSGFGVEAPETRPVRWDVSFETTGEKWLGITIPFVDDIPQEAVVDT